MKNLEAKFLVHDTGPASTLYDRFEVLEERHIEQTDVYLLSRKRYFKLRTENGEPKQLLRYDRLSSPTLRDSTYEVLELTTAELKNFAEFIFSSGAHAGTVRKGRQRIMCKDFLVNVDRVLDSQGHNLLYQVVEFEHFGHNSVALQQGILDSLLRIFNSHAFQIIPYSNIHMINMIGTASKAKELYRSHSQRGSLVLIDGGSGTGKSTIQKMLVDGKNFTYARRVTTRQPRVDDFVTDDYNFVAHDVFHVHALMGQYLEFRDFLFGMSYALPWSEFLPAICKGHDVLALINLGNGYFTKQLFPDALTVLLYADVHTLHSRLVNRGGLTDDQISERLRNNELAKRYTGAYDLAVDTGAHSPEETSELIMQRLRSVKG